VREIVEAQSEKTFRYPSAAPRIEKAGEGIEVAARQDNAVPGFQAKAGMNPSRKNIDALRDLAKTSREFRSLAQAVVIATNRAIDHLTDEDEQQHPGTQFVLYRKRKLIGACLGDVRDPSPEMLEKIADYLETQRFAWLADGLNPDE
jgi:hypothetical protein